MALCGFCAVQGSEKMKNYVLYNPLAGNGRGEKCVEAVEIPDGEAVFLDITEIADCKEFLKGLEKQDRLIICGGDGTLNRFINTISDLDIENDIFYLAAGSGNDFLKDINLKPSKAPIKINHYIKNLPEIYVKGNAYRFINGIGYGIDGYCCEERDRKMQTTNKPVNYTLIALKGLLFAFKPLNATVTVDGEEFKYERVWMAPTMLGRFFGGGMMIAPNQDRKNKDGSVTLIVAHDLSKLKIVSLFLSVFKGKHLKYKKYVAVHTGHSINVKFDRTAPLQIDGETISDVPEYSVTANKNVLHTDFIVL